MPESGVDILALTSDAFAREAAERGVALPNALEMFRGVFRDGAEAPSWATPAAMPVVDVETEGDTRKFTQRCLDGLETESVVLPQRSRTGRPRTALCVSSQIGCALGCAFCETGQMGLMRNLSTAEIVAQWHAARFGLGARIGNVVFMGMGEPMENLGAVVCAIEVLSDRNGPAIPTSRISVSTVGHVGGIERLAAFARRPGFRQLRLAVSLNAPNDDIRSTIMPINRAAPMDALMRAMLAWPSRDRLPILIEYVIIPGVNDRPDHADELCRYLEPLARTVNVIPYNPRRDSPWPAPDDGTVDRFIERVQSRGRLALRRRTMGRTLMGACGQLGNPGIRRRRFVEVGHLEGSEGRFVMRVRRTSPCGAIALSSALLDGRAALAGPGPAVSRVGVPRRPRRRR